MVNFDSGGTAAMDMMLNLIEVDHGPQLTLQVAEHFMHERIRADDDRQQLTILGQRCLTGASQGCEGYHIDAGSGNSPTSLTFITTGSFERAFKMKITQIECGAVNRGGEGCLQYHTGVSGQISSFNYIGNKHCKGLECFQFSDCFTNTGFDCILSDLDEYLSEESEGLQLSNQEYSICVRHERGFCGISYTACEVSRDNHYRVFVSKVS